MTQSRRKFLQSGSFVMLGGLSFGFYACKKSNDLVPENNSLNISGVSLPAALSISAGSDVTLTGKGFQIGDLILLVDSTTDGTVYTCTIGSKTTSTASFNLPGDIISGTYKISVSRGSVTLALGSTLLTIIAEADLPDIEGMTVKGRVYCNGVGVPGVVVSDGIELTTTDATGRYYLPSKKENGYVFISVPGNYEVVNVGNAPQFFQRLSQSGTVEQKYFSLIETDNNKHVVIPMADWHLAHRNNDLDQFTGTVLPDVNATIDQFLAEGTKVYVLTLGDLTWDLYWYSNNFGLNDYLPYMNKLNCPVFNVMGNHDNDPYEVGDRNAEENYRDLVGPTYYSFNLGKVHYVVLDNVEYINTGGSEGTIGNRNYTDHIRADQIDWLKKDLAIVTDKSTPVVVAMHTPLYRNPDIDNSGNQLNQLSLGNGSELIACLSDFSDVHILTGHTHINYSVEEENSLMEHNTAAICATWWWTGKNGYAGNHICKDGSPGGYSIWEMNGKDLQWLYKSVGYAPGYQFRSYDLNSVHITAANFASKSTDTALAEYAGSYAQANSNNEVLVNVWGWDSQWQIEVSENGQALEVTRVSAQDPLHIISYEALRLNAGATPTSSFVTCETAHLFKVAASSASSTIEIKVTDRFGNVYTESMERPKVFTWSMK